MLLDAAKLRILDIHGPQASAPEAAPADAVDGEADEVADGTAQEEAAQSWGDEAEEFRFDSEPEDLAGPASVGAGDETEG